ncbi:MAG: DEAD/DEAH box helicase, partial [Alphaproteobacteria bacterium]|nr:DEAD/DEAH box helicase [Alphaproteobacteria bacterium]
MHNIVKQDQRQEDTGHRRVIYGAPEGHDARILAKMALEVMSDDRVHVHIALDDARISVLKELLAFFAPQVRVLTFPAWDCLPYDRVSPHADIIAQRVSCLTQLMAWEHEKERYPRILLTSVNASLQRVMPRYVLREASFSAKSGECINIEDLQLFLTQNGYVRNETVRDVGEYAIRGGIIDLFPAGYEKPLRLDLFGDEIESVKTFDPLSQRTKKSIKSFSLQPATEFFMDQGSISRFRGAYREAFGAVRGGDPLYEAVGEGRRYNGIEHWLPLFYENMDTIFDYVPDASVSIDMHGDDAHKERMEQIRDFYQARKTLQKTKSNGAQGAVYNPVPIDALYIDDEQWQDLTGQSFILSNFGAPEDKLSDGSRDAGARKGRDFADLRAIPDGDVLGGALEHIAGLKAHGKKVMIACYSEGSRQRLEGMLEKISSDRLLECRSSEDFKKFKSNNIGIAILGLAHGFDSSDLAVLTEQDILGDRLTRKAKKSRKADNFLREVSALDEGDLVVHIDHGIGRFMELETLSAAGTVYDCLKIEYADGDKLYVPVLNLEVLSRFGSDEGTVQLDKLGGAGWQARKAKAKKNLMDMAEGLLKTAATRKLNKAEPLHLEDGLYEEFAARFPYQETEDQSRAIDEVIEGMAGGYAMDRLVCGDVGFGKTEVAIRAAYVAAMSGAQVALVVPTTLLARQHYANFCKRFEGTSIRIGQLSRLVPAKDAAKTRGGLEDGSIQIVIGTHALFAKSVKFDNLGLVIVDEEQRFGVKQKERLKEIKNNVHVLTLTATPIPRTLQMSL